MSVDRITVSSGLGYKTASFDLHVGTGLLEVTVGSAYSPLGDSGARRRATGEEVVGCA